MSESETKEQPAESGISQLEKEILDIIKICEKIPVHYRTKCFEILLINSMRGTKSAENKLTELVKAGSQKAGFRIPIDVKAFLTQYSIDEQALSKLFLIAEGNEIRPIYKINNKKKATGQLQIALLTSLENSIRDPNIRFEFSADDVRKRCQEYNSFDSANFATNFKYNKKFFKSLDDPEHIILSPDGKSELADIITMIING